MFDGEMERKRALYFAGPWTLVKGKFPKILDNSEKFWMNSKNKNIKHQISIRGNLGHLIQNYHSDRFLSVRIGSKTSSPS